MSVETAWGEVHWTVVPVAAAAVVVVAAVVAGSSVAGEFVVAHWRSHCYSVSRIAGSCCWSADWLFVRETWVGPNGTLPSREKRKGGILKREREIGDEEGMG